MARDTHTEAPEVFRDATKNPAVDLTKIDTLHELLGLALGDFEKVLADDRYVVNMSAWHAQSDEGCMVCLAGSVIAKTCGLGFDGDATSFVFNPHHYRWLHALDDLRCGYIAGAACKVKRLLDPPSEATALSAKWVKELAHLCSPATRKQSRALLSKLRLMQADLKEAGL